MTLTLVPPTPPDAKTALVERIKGIARPDGMVVDGRIKPGKVIEQGICPHCWKQGIFRDMYPPKPKIVKPPKPRRTKPKLVK